MMMDPSPDEPIPADSMSYGDLRRWAERLDVTIASASPGSLGRDVMGVYDDENKTILIDRGLTYTQKRVVLTHELVHWRHGDCACDPVFHAREENRTRRECAMLLINPIEYAIAESIYDGEIHRMANELKVTVSVIEDYRELLDEERPARFIGRVAA